MLSNNGDGTYTLGPADVMCIFKLPTGRHHVAILEESPMPGPPQPLDALSFLRLRSKMHHTGGAETLEEAQKHVAELREKLKVGDENVVADISIDMLDPICSIAVRNWIKEKITLKEALTALQP